MTDYTEQYRKLHLAEKCFGGGCDELFEEILPFLRMSRPKTVVDFGCGKGKLADKINAELPIKCYKYDIGIPEYSSLEIEKADFLINTDVLEHIPEDTLDEVLAKMASISDVGYIRICCRRAAQILPNGENAHCTIYPPKWWKNKLMQHWKTVIEVEIKDVTSCAFVTFVPKKMRMRIQDVYVKVFLKRIVKVLCLVVPKKIWRQKLRRLYK